MDVVSSALEFRVASVSRDQLVIEENPLLRFLFSRMNHSADEPKAENRKLLKILQNARTSTVASAGRAPDEKVLLFDIVNNCNRPAAFLIRSECRTC